MNDTQFTNFLIKGFFYTALSKSLIFLVSIFAVAFLAKSLSPANFNSWSYLIALFPMYTNLDIGSLQSLKNRLSVIDLKSKDKESYEISRHFLVIIISLCCFIIVSLASFQAYKNLLPDFLSPDLFFLIVFFTALMSIFSVPYNLSFIYGFLKLRTLGDILLCICIAGLVFFSGHLHFKVFIFLYFFAYLVSNLFVFIIFLRRIKFSLMLKIKLDDVIEIVGKSVWFWIFSLLVFLVSFAPIFLAEKHLKGITLVDFNAKIRVSLIFLSVSAAIIPIFSKTLTESFENKRLSQTRNRFILLIAISVFFGLGFPLIVFLNQILHQAFIINTGTNYIENIYICLWIIFSAIANGISFFLNCISVYKEQIYALSGSICIAFLVYNLHTDVAQVIAILSICFASLLAFFAYKKIGMLGESH
jgi:O-antigen/teichoic acid export membrane protein